MAKRTVVIPIMNAMKELNTDCVPATVGNIARYSGLKHTAASAGCMRLVKEGKLKRVDYNLYALDDRQLELPQPEPKQDNLSILIDTLNQLPNQVLNAFDSIIELVLEPEVEIINMVDRRNKRISDLQVLLDQKRVETSNLRAKIDELHNNLNRLRAQKNRVIPEDKIIIRGNH